MLKEKEFVATPSQEEALHELLSHVWEMMPENLDDREKKRDQLKELYFDFMNSQGWSLTTERRSFNNLYSVYDRFLKLCKNVSPDYYRKFLKELKETKVVEDL